VKSPLNNVTVLIPRPIEQSNEFADKLEKLGATPVIFPLIELKPINQDQLKTIFSKNEFDWIIFTSGIAVKCFFEIIHYTKVKAKIAAVGSQTKAAIEELGLKVDFIPSAATAQKLAKEIPVTKNEKILIPRSKISNDTIIDILKQKEAKITVIDIYDNTPVAYTKEEIEEVLNTPINVITFTSGSTVNSFLDLIRKYKIRLNDIHKVSIGPSTTAEAQKRFLEIDATAENHSIDGMIDEILKIYA
jgi:uroporphyrinogen-III synthase